MKFVCLLAALLTASCDAPRECLHAVYAIDLSASIEPRAITAAFEAASGSLGLLERGDCAAVIPIVGDDLNDVQGRIIRYELPANRMPYDGDLRHLAAEEKQALVALRAATIKQPSARTDILGAIDLAAEELAPGGPQNGTRVLMVLSDFLQDDVRYRFATDRALADPTRAETFARALAKERSRSLEEVHVFLGALTSKDLARLTPERRAAIRTFWTTYLGELGAGVQWATDGSGMVVSFLTAVRTKRKAPGADSTETRLAELMRPFRLAW